ncbi:MAG: hypothetical protein WBF68_08340 [Atribacterota bacterium]
MGINILNFPYRWDGVMAAYKKGYGVVAMNPLFGGAIPNHEKELSFLASGGETPTEAALRFLISYPQISVVLNDFTTREHIDMACRVAHEATPFNDKDLEIIRKKIGDDMNSACTGCGYCDNCPQDIPVPSYMQLYNEKQIFGGSDKEMKKKSYLWGITESHGARANEYIECGQCEEVCTQYLPIIERLKEIAYWEKK